MIYKFIYKHSHERMVFTMIFILLSLGINWEKITDGARLCTETNKQIVQYFWDLHRDFVHFFLVCPSPSNVENIDKIVFIFLEN